MDKMLGIAIIGAVLYVLFVVVFLVECLLIRFDVLGRMGMTPLFDHEQPWYRTLLWLLGDVVFGTSPDDDESEEQESKP